VSTFRADLITHLTTVANSYRTANPTKLRRVFTARPGSFGEMPCTFIGSRSETSTEDAGIVLRVITTTLVCVDTFGDNEQLSDRMDVLVDGLASALRTASVAHVTAQPGVEGGIIDFVGNIEDGEIEQPGTETRPAILYRTASLFITAHIQEGRV